MRKIELVAATALWLDAPLVIHDRDVDKVPGLRVLTLHADWQIREQDVGASPSSPLWLGERSVASKWSYECASR